MTRRRDADARLRVIALTSCLVSIAACTTPTLPTTTVIIPPPAIVCPAAPAAAMATNGHSAVVTFGAPTVTGGTAPVTTSCTPSSGATLPLGSTVVKCVATDAVQRAASCSFTATVLPPTPQLGVRRILAFGDSITEGEVPVVGEFNQRRTFVQPANAYPAVLTTLLAQRYSSLGALLVNAFSIAPDNSNNVCSTNPPLPSTTGIVVINAGCLGEAAAGSGTQARLSSEIATYHPDLILLLEGTNDLDNEGVQGGVQGVLSLIAIARASGAHVMVGTLPPQVEGEQGHGGDAEAVVPFNAQLVPAATQAGAIVVDLYSDIATNVNDWISPLDGLHLTAAGYQEVARVWFNAIQSAFDVTPTATAATPARPPQIASPFSITWPRSRSTPGAL